MRPVWATATASATAEDGDAITCSLSSGAPRTIGDTSGAYNAAGGLSLSSPTRVGGWVSFNGKANYMDPTMSSWLGGYTFNVYAEDNNQPGTSADKFWIQIISNGAIVGACSMPSAASRSAVPAVPIAGGNIVAPHK